MLLPGAVEQPQPQFVSRFLEGQSGVTIKHVACGDLFTACLTGELVRAYSVETRESQTVQFLLSQIGQLRLLSPEGSPLLSGSC